jgi:C4-dicarboxylate transporter DctQ subunit
MAILGSAAAINRSSLINMDILLRALPGKLKTAVLEISCVISMIFTFIVIKSSFPFLELGIGQKSPALKIDMFFLYLVIPIGFGLMFLNLLVKSLKRRMGVQ